MKFQAVFTFDPDYQGYVAEVPELPGCMSQGKTLDETITNIKDAITGYLHVQAEHGVCRASSEFQAFVGEVVV